MTAILASVDALNESRSMISFLEQHRTDLPHADNLLATHRATHQKLEDSHQAVAAAVATWRTALSERWEAEIQGWRVYRQTCSQVEAHTADPNAPIRRLIEQISSEADGSPAGVLACLRHLSAALHLAGDELAPFRQNLPAINAEAERLERALLRTTECEHARRRAALEERVIRETYRRVSNDTRLALGDLYAAEEATAWQGA